VYTVKKSGSGGDKNSSKSRAAALLTVIADEGLHHQLRTGSTSIRRRDLLNVDVQYKQVKVF
jgi:hypothetical protein